MAATMTLAEVGARSFETVQPGSCYRLAVPNVEVVLEVDRLVWQKQELTGELLVRCDLGGTDAIDGVLSVASFNLSSARARSERASLLKGQSRAPDIPWAALIEELCQRTLTAERTGDPAIALRDIDRPTDEQRLVEVFGFALPFQHRSTAFGDGGGGKSLLGLYIGGLMAAEGYRVLLADWELDGGDHRERYERLFGAAMPATLFYTRCGRPMLHEADRLRRIVRSQGIDFSIHDSVGFACHDAPETATAALAYYQATRQLGIGGLDIAHVSKAEGGDQKPFGSAFWHNSARATWNLKPTEEAGRLTVGVFNRKHNLAPKQAPFAFDVTFDRDRTTFRLADIGAVAEFAGKVPAVQRIKAILRAGARTRDELLAELSQDDVTIKPDTIRRTLDREVKASRLVLLPGPQERYGLPMSRAAS